VDSALASSAWLPLESNPEIFNAFGKRIAEKILRRFKIGELPREPGLLDAVPVMPIACALVGAGSVFALRVLARKIAA